MCKQGCIQDIFCGQGAGNFHRGGVEIIMHKDHDIKNPKNMNFMPREPQYVHVHVTSVNYMYFLWGGGGGDGEGENPSAPPLCIQLW